MKRIKKHLISVIDVFLTEKTRAGFYKMVGMQVGKNVRIRNKCFFDKVRNVKLADGCFVNRGCQFHTGPFDGKITIGENVRLAMNVTMVCVSHKIGDHDLRAGETEYLDINIGKGSWICANVLILPGVTIGDGVIVAAGAVVTSDLEHDCLYAGVPARKIRQL